MPEGIYCHCADVFCQWASHFQGIEPEQRSQQILWQTQTACWRMADNRLSARTPLQIGTYCLYPKSGIAIHRSLNMCAAIFGFLSLVNTPFLLPWTRIIP